MPTFGETEKSALSGYIEKRGNWQKVVEEMWAKVISRERETYCLYTHTHTACIYVYTSRAQRAGWISFRTAPHVYLPKLNPNALANQKRRNGRAKRENKKKRGNRRGFQLLAPFHTPFITALLHQRNRSPRPTCKVAKGR